MVGGSADLTVDGVVVVDTAFTFKTRNLKQSHLVVEAEEDVVGWIAGSVDGYPVYFETCGMIYLRIEQRCISSLAALVLKDICFSV